MKIRVRVQGTSAAAARILAYGEARRAAVARLIAATCLKIESDAKRLAPVDSGRLRASIHAALQDVASALHGGVIAATDYAAFVELGTSRAGAQPYLVPAFEAAIPGFITALRQIYA